MQETIIALATAPFKSALAIVRASGEDALILLSEVFSTTIDLSKDKNVYYGYIKDEDKIIDQVVVITYVAPHGYTGENAFEIICHGSVGIANDIISLFIKHGARLALPG